MYMRRQFACVQIGQATHDMLMRTCARVRAVQKGIAETCQVQATLLDLGARRLAASVPPRRGLKGGQTAVVRPISLLRLFLLRFVDSRLPVHFPWT